METSSTKLCMEMLDDWRTRLTRLSGSMSSVEIAARMAPPSRMATVRARVSTPSMATMLCLRRKSDRLPSHCQLLGS